MAEFLERRKTSRSFSISDLSDTLLCDPTKTKVWTQLGEALLKKGQYEKALESFETALCLTDKPIDFQPDEIKRLIRTGKHEKARESLLEIKEMCWQDYRGSNNNIFVGDTC